jgi:hypothetical protein
MSSPRRFLRSVKGTREGVAVLALKNERGLVSENERELQPASFTYREKQASEAEILS